MSVCYERSRSIANALRRKFAYKTICWPVMLLQSQRRKNVNYALFIQAIILFNIVVIDSHCNVCIKLHNYTLFIIWSFTIVINCMGGAFFKRLLRFNYRMIGLNTYRAFSKVRCTWTHHKLQFYTAIAQSAGINDFHV